MRIEIPTRFLLVAVMFLFITVPASAATMCSPTNGPWACTMFEGSAGSYPFWTVINAGNVNAFINSVTAGPIINQTGDPSDYVLTDPIGFDNCTGVTLAPGGSCQFNQTFTTESPGELGPLADAMSTITYVLTVTPANSGTQAFQFPTAIITVNDTPEPGTLAMFASGLIVLGGVVRKHSRRG